MILVRAGENSTALITDEMQDSREIVVKPVGAQLATIRGISGATILGDGRIVVILDVGALVRSSRPAPDARRRRGTEKKPTLRSSSMIPSPCAVSRSELERTDLCVTAKDGVEASVSCGTRPEISRWTWKCRAGWLRVCATRAQRQRLERGRSHGDVARERKHRDRAIEMGGTTT